MKITKSKLKQIIREELIKESFDPLNLEIGTELQNKYGTWTVTNVTHHEGATWYDLDGERGSVVAYPTQIGRDYTVVKGKDK